MKTPTRQPVALTAATLCLALLTLGAAHADSGRSMPPPCANSINGCKRTRALKNA